MSPEVRAYAERMKIDCTNYTETVTTKRADRTLNYRPIDIGQAKAMADEFQAELGDNWEVFVAGCNPHGHGWGRYEYTVYAVRFF